MSWRQLKHFCEGPPQYGLNVGGGEYTDEGVRLLRTTDIQEHGALVPGKAGVFLPPDMVEPRYLLRKGDLLFSRAGSLGRCFRVATTTQPVTFAGYLVRFRPLHDVDPRYLEYCAATRFFQGKIEADAVTSTISNFNAERYGNLLLPDRSQEEQRTIADFLDTETARIDALIMKKRRMIERLWERHWALLDELANVGLSSASCDMTVLKRLASLFTDGDWIESPYITATGIRLLQTGNIGRGYFRDQGDRYISDETFHALRCTEVLPGDVLISRLANTVGQACLAPDLGCRMVASVDVVIMRPSGLVGPDYLVRYMSTERHLALARLEARGTTMQRLARSQVGALPVPLPDLPQQRDVVARVDSRGAPILRAVEQLKLQIDLLQEHREVLITAAVTGHLELPGVAA